MGQDMGISHYIVTTSAILLISTAAHSYTISSKYCAADTSYKCVWCLGGGATHAGNCVPQYAGCTGGVTDVSVGSTTGNVRCSVTGFCYTSCGTRTRTEGNLTITERGSGCTCDEWTVESVTANCSYGYYYSASAGECVRCPSVMCADGCVDNEYIDENGQAWAYGQTSSMVGMTKNDCYLKGSYSICRNGECSGLRNKYKDETGTFVIKSRFNMYQEGCKWQE